VKRLDDAEEETGSSDGDSFASFDTFDSIKLKIAIGDNRSAN
jgi:hypothetical protein